MPAARARPVFRSCPAEVNHTLARAPFASAAAQLPSRPPAPPFSFEVGCSKAWPSAPTPRNLSSTRICTRLRRSGRFVCISAASIAFKSAKSTGSWKEAFGPKLVRCALCLVSDAPVTTKLGIRDGYLRVRSVWHSSNPGILRPIKMCRASARVSSRPSPSHLNRRARSATAVQMR